MSVTPHPSILLDELASIQVEREALLLRNAELERALIKLEARCNKQAIDILQLGREIERLNRRLEKHHE